ncbi:MAG: rhomboid family intramembrane serine protease [Kiritimatiellae bacterium]|nr:rhomboid family intramembrane serine protease [Kiritimatiellia bacterium]
MLLFSAATIRVIAVCLCVYLVMLTASQVHFGYTGVSYGYILKNCFALNWPLLSHGFLWQLISYMFLHDSWMHLLCNMWGCFIIGSVLEHEHGTRFFLKVYFIGGILSGIGWLAYTAIMPQLSFLIPLTGWIPKDLGVWLHAGAGLRGSIQSSMCLGASGGVCALIGCFFAMYPTRELYVLLFFVLPLRLKSHTLLWVLLALTFFDMIFIQSPVAHAAHLSGGLFGYIYGLRRVRAGK